MDILEDLAEHHRCGGCDAVITDESMSKYWCGPVCQRRWQKGQGDRPAWAENDRWADYPETFQDSPFFLPADLARSFELMIQRPLDVLLRPIATGISIQVTGTTTSGLFCDALIGAADAARELATHWESPQERALRLRRERNTGPAPRPRRAPRRLGPPGVW